MNYEWLLCETILCSSGRLLPCRFIKSWLNFCALCICHKFLNRQLPLRLSVQTPKTVNQCRGEARPFMSLSVWLLVYSPWLILNNCHPSIYGGRKKLDRTIILSISHKWRYSIKLISNFFSKHGSTVSFLGVYFYNFFLLAWASGRVDQDNFPIQTSWNLTKLTQNLFSMPV